MAEAPPPPYNDPDPDNIPLTTPPTCPPPPYLPSYEEATGRTLSEVVRTFIETRTLAYHSAWNCSPRHYNFLVNLIGQVIDTFDYFEKYVEMRATDGILLLLRDDVAMQLVRRLTSLVRHLRIQIMATATRSGVMSEARRTFLRRVMEHMEAMMRDGDTNYAYESLISYFDYRLNVWTLIYTLVEVMPMDDNIEVPPRMMSFLDSL